MSPMRPTLALVRLVKGALQQHVKSGASAWPARSLRRSCASNRQHLPGAGTTWLCCEISPIAVTPKRRHCSSPARRRFPVVSGDLLQFEACAPHPVDSIRPKADTRRDRWRLLNSGERVRSPARQYHAFLEVDRLVFAELAQPLAGAADLKNFEPLLHCIPRRAGSDRPSSRSRPAVYQLQSWVPSPHTLPRRRISG